MKKGSFGKLVVASVIILNVIFTTAVLFVFYKTSVEPTALIAAWFSFTTGELWLLKDIKKNKRKEKQIDEN